jgi:hypothetical protein
VITGAALGLPGAPNLFDDGNVSRILRGEQGIDVIPTRFREELLEKHITRLVKDDGNARFESIGSAADVIKLAGRAGAFDLGADFGVDADRLPALGQETRLAIAAGLDALRDAGIPLVRATGPRAWARSSPTAGCCPTTCATPPASSSPAPSRA